MLYEVITRGDWRAEPGNSNRRTAWGRNPAGVRTYRWRRQVRPWGRTLKQHKFSPFSYKNSTLSQMRQGCTFIFRIIFFLLCNLSRFAFLWCNTYYPAHKLMGSVYPCWLFSLHRRHILYIFHQYMFLTLHPQIVITSYSIHYTKLYDMIFGKWYDNIQQNL